MSKFIDITGQKYGYLTVIKRMANSVGGNTRWLCKCECGNEKVITGSALRQGTTKSCGCKTKELFRNSKENNLTGNLDEAILNTLSELKKRRKGLTVTNEKQRLMYIITSAQIEILESLNTKYERIGKQEYKEQCEKWDKAKNDNSGSKKLYCVYDMKYFEQCVLIGDINDVCNYLKCKKTSLRGSIWRGCKLKGRYKVERIEGVEECEEL